MNSPLNPGLYNLLQLHFGEVGIVAPGTAISWRLVRNSFAEDPEKRKRLVRRVEASGEEYKIKCPLCRDTSRPRLYVNHMWGVHDEQTGGKNFFLAQCYNEGCLDSYARQKFFYDWVFDSTAPDSMRRGRARILEGKPAATGLDEMPPAGVEMRIDEVKRNHPHHEAVVYLENRGFDIDTLARRYGVTYCVHSRYSLCINRIIIPIYWKGKLVGWQARFVGDEVRGKSLKRLRIPKFWSCPNMNRRLIAYNMETAARHDTILIVEGPTDVWAAGPQALGLMGKTMNPQLLSRFLALIRQLHPTKPPVICVVLDPDQDEREKAKGKPHHIDVLVAALMNANLPVFGLRLPRGSDPGTFAGNRKFLRELVRKEARRHGMTVNFRRPRRPAD